jgi:fumarate reductase flavoprotein subunit
MPVPPATGQKFDIVAPVLIIGAGASGLVAALAAKDAGVDPVVLERDLVPSGSTALSSGMILTCETRMQRDMGVEDDLPCLVQSLPER